MPPFRLALLAFLCLGTLARDARASDVDYLVQLSARIQTLPPQITLCWAPATTGQYQVFRKAPDATAWGSPRATLPASATCFVDTQVLTGEAYEYRVDRGGFAQGYLLAAIDRPLMENRGVLLLVVDNSQAVPLARELARLEQDLAADGWRVKRLDVLRTDPVAEVKARIQALYRQAPSLTKALMLFGHVPVPYSGMLAPDGHSEHLGPWPADTFYADLDDDWTDQFLTGPYNAPGDGIYDQNNIPSEVELQVGRVDLVDMPAFLPKTETDLLRQYLDKDHRFRQRRVIVPRRALVRDVFEGQGYEPFGATGWRNFAPLVGPANTQSLGWNALNTAPYLWAYGAAPGFDESWLQGIGSSAQWAQADPQVVFTLLFGSWAIDWNTRDNLQRAVLASEHLGLTSATGGRPDSYFHAMGLGETIGYGMRQSQRNGLTSTYAGVSGNYGDVYLALLGDPTLRLHPVAPPRAVAGTLLGNGIDLHWLSSPDTDLLGYHVYRGSSKLGPFHRLTPSLLATTHFTDTAPLTGQNVYMVRAVKRETSPSGTYLNPSQGVFLVMGFSPGGGNEAPRITSRPAASPPDAPLGTASTTLQILADDDGGEANLTYTWGVIAGTAPVTFAENGTHASRTTEARFQKAGTYLLRCLVRDQGNLQAPDIDSYVIVRVGGTPP